MPRVVSRALVAIPLLAGCLSPVTVEGSRSAITNGTDDVGDRAVVGLLSDGAVICSGTLISSRVILTAAHCLASHTFEAALFGSDLSTGVRAPVVHGITHPGFDPITLANDVALLLLDPAPMVAPAPLIARALEPSLVGQPIRLVGFGQTSTNGGSASRKREGTAVVHAFADTYFDSEPQPSLTCEGDSGGPAFATLDGVEALAGVTSGGDAECLQYSRSTRIDVFLPFVKAFVAQAEARAAQPGERCFYATNCAVGECLAPADAPSFQYCSIPCRASDECPYAMLCQAEPSGFPQPGELRCLYPAPSPGALGAPCARFADCESLLCARPSETVGGTCSIPCSLDGLMACPDHYECRQDADQRALQACIPERSSASGCSFATGAPEPVVALVWVPLVAIGRRRWRRPQQSK